MGLDFALKGLVAVAVMVLILDGNSEIGAHVSSSLLTCLRHLMSSRPVTKSDFFSPKRPIFLYDRAPCFELPSNISIMDGSRQFFAR